MDEYVVKLYAKASRDLDEIYEYIARSLFAPGAALGMMNDLETAILSLEVMPKRGAVRKVGRYAGKGYRQLFVKNYIIIYKVIEEKKEVHIVTVRYAASQF